MPRDTPKRRAAKRQEILEGLEEVHDHMVHTATIEVCIKKLTEALMFILKESSCRKKQ